MDGLVFWVVITPGMVGIVVAVSIIYFPLYKKSVKPTEQQGVETKSATRKGGSVDSVTAMPETILHSAGNDSTEIRRDQERDGPVPETTASVTLGLAGDYPRDIKTVDRELPLALAEKVKDFPAAYRYKAMSTTEKEGLANHDARKEEAVKRKNRWREWESIRSEVNACLKGEILAELQPISFVNSQGGQVFWDLTPVLKGRFTALIRQCHAQSITKHKAREEFKALSQDWQEETGHPLSIETSPVFKNLFEKPRLSVWGALLQKFSS